MKDEIRSQLSLLDARLENLEVVVHRLHELVSDVQRQVVDLVALKSLPEGSAPQETEEDQPDDDEPE